MGHKFMYTPSYIYMCLLATNTEFKLAFKGLPPFWEAHVGHQILCTLKNLNLYF